MSLDFYNGSGSPFAWRVWLALEHKQVPYQIKTLSFDRREHRTPEFLAINPRGKVPAIVDGDVTLWESGAILEYLEDRYPERPLLPGDAAGRALARRIAAEAVRFFRSAVFEHHNEEERELFPVVLKNATEGEERNKVQTIVDRLVREHRHLEADLRNPQHGEGGREGAAQALPVLRDPALGPESLVQRLCRGCAALGVARQVEGGELQLL